MFKFLSCTSNTVRHNQTKNHRQLLSITPRTIKAYLFNSFSWIKIQTINEDVWIKIQTINEDVHVTKVVGLVTRIPKHLDLYFSVFSANF